MATLSKHGSTLATIERLRDKLSYHADGTILRNQGDGWKLYKSVKPGFDPVQVAQDAVANYAKRLDERPAFAAYRKAVHDATCNGNRYMLVEVLNALANDPDGVWSELNDNLNIPLDVDECCELCLLHEAANAEAKTFANTP